jgi:hypothetical protein
MSAFVLSGAKRTYLLAKISSNLRPLKLQRRRARNGGSEKKLPAPPGRRQQCAQGPISTNVMWDKSGARIQRPLISGSQVRALVRSETCVLTSPSGKAAFSANSCDFFQLPFGLRRQDVVSRALSAGKSLPAKIPFLADKARRGRWVARSRRQVWRKLAGRRN